MCYTQLASQKKHTKWIGKEKRTANYGVYWNMLETDVGYIIETQFESVRLRFYWMTFQSTTVDLHHIS